MMLTIIAYHASYVSLVLWLVLGSTDWVDGWVARKQGTTRSGAFLDPLADKILVLGVFVSLVIIREVSPIPVAIIALREITISIYRVIVARSGVSVAATIYGKLKTLFQDLAITICLLPIYNRSHGWPVRSAIWIAVIATVLSGIDYFLKARSGYFKLKGTTGKGE
jgi:CDP-diacylglycerol--glycerol-3-phosphate 3-phosphatidyltransferase